jgi:hypothetical protein
MDPSKEMRKSYQLRNSSKGVERGSFKDSLSSAEKGALKRFSILSQVFSSQKIKQNTKLYQDK